LAADIKLTPAQHAFLKSFLPDFSGKTWEVSLAGQAASQRYFVRLHEKTGVASFVLVVWDGKDEDWPRFLALPAEIGSLVPFLPIIYKNDARHGLILEEDLGTMTLCRLCGEMTIGSPKIEAAYRGALDALCVWQSLAIELSPTIASRVMDLDTFLWETDYFARRCVVDFCGCERLLDAQWERERRSLAVTASALPRTFIHRDFQSENILLTNGKIRFVDFQGARLGPPAYDVASLLFDPYVDALTQDLSARLFAYYTSLPLRVKADPHTFHLCAVQRLMQALGAYGNLSIHKGKERYRKFVPLALKRLRGVMEKLPEFKAMRAVVEGCVEAVGKG
jgi:aminoglycoside/choline kinase family phosphotransferase